MACCFIHILAELSHGQFWLAALSRSYLVSLALISHCTGHICSLPFSDGFIVTMSCAKNLQTLVLAIKESKKLVQQVLKHCKYM